MVDYPKYIDDMAFYRCIKIQYITPSSINFSNLRRCETIILLILQKVQECIHFYYRLIAESSNRSLRILKEKYVVHHRWRILLPSNARYDAQRYILYWFRPWLRNHRLIRFLHLQLFVITTGYRRFGQWLRWSKSDCNWKTSWHSVDRHIVRWAFSVDLLGNRWERSSVKESK